MSRSLSRNLVLGAIGLAIVAIILGVVSVSGATSVTDPTTGAVTVTGANDGLAAGAVLLYAVSGIVSFVGAIGALVKTAQLGRWGWFVGILITAGVGLLIYIFAGPQTANTPATATVPPTQQ